jgi:TPR repeat protein
MEGIGLKKDLHAAFEWFNKAAEQNDSLSQCMVGHCYENGIGISSDLPKAIYWLKKSVAQGDREGQFRLGVCYVNGHGVEKDIDGAQRLFGLAAAKNHGKALLYLSSLLNKP